MSHQEQTNRGTYIGILKNGNLYFGNEPPSCGFATDSDAVMKEPHVGGFAGEASMEEQPNELSVLPQSLPQCFLHRIWGLSKTCCVCGAREYGGAVTSNIPLFHRFGCNFVRACAKHHAMVSAHFAKPEFNEPIDNPCGLYHVIRRCSGCGMNFSAISDSSNSFCDKGCHGDWLDRHLG